MYNRGARRGGNLAGDSFADLDQLEARGRWLRRGVFVVILSAALVAALLVWQLWLGGGDEESGEVETVAVGRGTIRATIAASGSAEAADKTELRFATVGRVEEILVTLGQEVKGGAPLAVLETDDLENQLATAEANLAMARIRLRQIQKGADEADLAAAEQSVASAQAGLSKAQRDLNDLLEGASEADLAAAKQSVASAQSTLESARAGLAQLQDSPSAAEVAAAEAAVAAAEANVRAAENLEDSAESSLDAAEALLRVAGYSYCSAIAAYNSTYDPDLSESLCDPFPVPVDQGDINDLLAILSDPSVHLDFSVGSTTLAELIQALLQANSAYISAENSVDNAEESLESAEAALASAEANLDALGDIPTQEELKAAQEAVAAGEESLAAALVRLQELQEGADADDIKVAQDAVESAEANVRAAIATRDEVLRGADLDEVELQTQQVRLAEIAVDEARKALDEATLKAPYDGTVAAIDIGVGDLVSAQSALAAVTLLTPGALKVRLTVGETDLPGLHPGMVGVIIFDAIQERPFPLVLTAIGLAPQVEQGIVIYVVEGALVGVGEEVENRPVPGMNGSAVLVTEERRNVLMVPNRAIRRRGDDVVVEVMVGGKLEIQTVETGLSDTDNTEVVSGLEEGDLVVLPGSTQAEQEEEQESLPEGIR